MLLKNYSQNLKIGAFQTRNILHLGHELIINEMLEFCDHVVINPVLGPKKREMLIFFTKRHLFAPYKKSL